MNRFLKRIPELKELLLHEEELSKVWRFFMDHFADHAEFIDLCEIARHPFVEKIVVQISQELFGNDGQISGLRLVRLPERHFVHGGLSMGGRIGGVIYFEDSEIGMIAVVEKIGSDYVKYARFSSHAWRGRSEPSSN